MTGLVYKEWKQNRWFILSMILCGLAPLFVLLLMRGEISNIGNAPIRIGGLIAGFLVAGALQMLVLRGDDRKLWGYWITATPDGYKGFLRVKYEMIFGMIVLFLFSLQCVDRGYCAVAADMGITEIDEVSGIAVVKRVFAYKKRFTILSFKHKPFYVLFTVAQVIILLI